MCDLLKPRQISVTSFGPITVDVDVDVVDHVLQSLLSYRTELHDMSSSPPVPLTVGVHFVDHVLQLRLGRVLAEGPHHRAELIRRDRPVIVLVEQCECLPQFCNVSQPSHLLKYNPTNGRKILPFARIIDVIMPGLLQILKQIIKKPQSLCGLGNYCRNVAS